MDKEEILIRAIKYFNGDELAANVWLDKYCLKNKDKYIETNPDQTIVRVSTELARIEKNYKNSIDYDQIYNLMKNYSKFVLGGSPLFGIGNNTTLSTLGSCFVIDSPEDSYGGIFRADQELAQLMKRRGGVGIDISSLRPKKSDVNNAASSSTGAVSFMNRFSNTTREVAQEGRRGALMITMNIDYPDIIDFITAKDDLTKITGANISVKITDDFMNTNNMYNKIVWDTLIHQAWKNAEPGVLFWDRIIENSPADCYPNFRTISTNPCSELPLCAYDSCRLSAINIYEYVINPFTNESYFDFTQLEKDVQIYQRLMDDIVDLEAEKINAILNKISTDPESNDVKKIESDVWNKILIKLLSGRRTGLGQMGLADAGAALNLKYGSDEFIKFSADVAKTIAINSYISSIEMAKERGCFLDCDITKEFENPYISRILSNCPGLGHDYRKYGRRNIANLTIAPTGSIAILSQCSSGIEPVFSLSYKRKRKVTEDNPNKSFKDKQGDWWEEYNVIHPKFKKWMQVNNYSDDNIKESPYYLSTAHEINPYNKLSLQSKIQPWVDHSISITYNLPESTTEKEVSMFYATAWKLGLKGMTVYRDGCRDGVLTTNNKTFIQHDAPKRPIELKCNVHEIKIKGKTFIIVVSLLENKPYEVFVIKDKNNKYPSNCKVIKYQKGEYLLTTLDWNNKDKGYNFGIITESLNDEEKLITRLISTSLRHGADIKFVVEQLNKSTGDITSFGKAVARCLKRYIPDGTTSKDICLRCGAKLTYEGGCCVCKECGWSKCD